MAEDNFTILELISQSSTTSVYKAHQNVLDRTILLKVLHKHLLRDKELVARFSREARACAILKSDNIVQVYDLTEVDGAPAIVMEYVEGKSLEDFLEDESVRSEDLLKKVAVSVLRALSYAHDRGVTHRDIKPGNILVSQDGQIKVTDFGLAAVSDAPSLTMEGSLIGTPAYMSPEQARGEAVDQRTDLFSLGVTLVEVLTGEKILAGRSYAECISKIQSFDVSSIDNLSSKCSPHIFAFLRRLMAPNKYDRFASASEALKSFEEGASEPPAPRDTVKPAKKENRRGVLAAAIVAVAVILVGLSFVFRHPSGKTADVAADTSGTATRPHELPGTSNAKSKPDSIQPERRKERKQQPLSEKGSTTPPAVVSRRDTTGHQLVADNVVSTDSGYIAVQCTPWAKIFIDNEYAGTTPISGSIKVPVGDHTVTFNNPNFAPIVRQVSVRRDTLSNINADFLKSSGYLIVSVDPWGKVYVDDQFRETTPSATPIIVSAGTRRIRIHNPAFQDIVKTLNVSPGDTLRLKFTFIPKDSE